MVRKGRETVKPQEMGRFLNGYFLFDLSIYFGEIKLFPLFLFEGFL
jgi:hypothetical protein